MARRGNKSRKGNESNESSGGWITTFSDLMSLLLTFFILLYSMSNVSQVKFNEASQSIQMALSGKGGSTILEEAAPTVPETEAAETTTDKINPEISALYKKVTDYVEEHAMQSKVSVEMDQDGVYVDIQESILFASGDAEVSPQGKRTLNQLADLIATFENKIVVEGYTDNLPIKNQKFDSNWELSAGRAVSVLRYLSEEKDIDPNRLSAKGYGEYNPSAPNDTIENKAKNRRVNIVIVYEDKETS